MAAGQRTTYAKEGDQGDLASFKKSFKLNSPGSGTSFSIEGSGRWVFNRKLGMSESLNYKQDLKITDGNVSVSVPVSITYRRLSNEAWAKIEAERIEATRTKSEREVLEAAVARAAAGRTLSAAERQKILVDEKAKLSVHLTKEFSSNRESKVVGMWVSHDTPLPTGLIISANRYSQSEAQYFPATVDSVLENGLVRVRYSYFGARKEERLREDIYIAPQVVHQKSITPQQLAELQAYHKQVENELATAPEGADARERLIKSYRDGSLPVLKTGAELPAGLKLPRHMVLVGKKKDGKWYKLIVLKDLDDGKVEVKFSLQRTNTTLSRADLRLPPPEVRAPNLAPTYPVPSTTAAPSSPSRVATPSPVATDVFRIWTDSTGKFTVEAKYVSNANGSVQIIRKDGKKLNLPFGRLSKADQQFVESLAENPFE